MIYAHWARLALHLLIGLTAGFLAGCDTQSRGFALPPGDAEQGHTEFVELGCNACHSIAGVEKLAPDSDTGVHVFLGGTVTRVKTYGDLVTSIINPSHKLSRRNDPTTVDAEGNSRMWIYNDVMTVAQLVNLTTFLQAHYEVRIPDYHMYAYP